METSELAKKALESIRGESFSCGLSAYEGGACGDGWTGCEDLYLSRAEILYLLFKAPEVNGEKTEEIDLDATLLGMAHEGSWPDGGASASVNETIPKELEDLSDLLSELLENREDSATLEEVRSKLKNIKDGEYTFTFDVYGDYSYCFAEDVEETIQLTANEARALLKYVHEEVPEAFEGICDDELGEDFLNDKAKEIGIADGYDNYSYSYDCEVLENYLRSWEFVIKKIDEGVINEGNLAEWLEYFNDKDNFEYDIEDWKR